MVSCHLEFRHNNVFLEAIPDIHKSLNLYSENLSWGALNLNHIKYEEIFSTSVSPKKKKLQLFSVEILMHEFHILMKLGLPNFDSLEVGRQFSDST